jgi:penicillin V acylase-like amidase (Ntn superfamily)
VRRFPSLAGPAIGLFALAVLATPARPCARVLWADTGRAVAVGRTMNWIEDPRTSLWAFPRGLDRTGEAGPNSLTWTSRYGSVAAGFYDFATAEGLNEKGLAVSVLWLDEADYGKRDPAVPGVSTSLWGQLYLDRFATVAEAVEFTKATPFQLAPVRGGGEASALHLALADRTGDSAVIEYIGGKLVIHHDRKLAVLTNSPPLPAQQSNLSQYRGFGGDRDLPRSAARSADRFVLASAHLKDLARPADDRQAVASVLDVLRRVSVPGPPSRWVPSTTHWRTVADLTNGAFYFESVNRPTVVWVRLDRLDLAAGRPVRKLDLARDPDLAGEASGRFEKAEPLKFSAAE